MTLMREGYLHLEHLTTDYFSLKSEQSALRDRG
jgi:hypothetical protein